MDICSSAMCNKDRSKQRGSQLTAIENAPHWERIELQPFVKDFFRENAATADRLSRDVDAYRRSNSIAVTGSEVPKPILSIEEASLPQHIVNAVQAWGSLTSVHAQCWPVALRGRDMLACVHGESEGSTLGYLVPAIVHINGQLPLKPGDGPIALVLTATRASALKIQHVASELSKRAPVRSACVVSGSPRWPQLEELQGSSEMCIATPGRLASFLRESKVNLGRCTFLVLDETDRMLDIGFGPEIRQVVRHTRPDRQTLVWAASLEGEVRLVADDVLSNYVEAAFGTPQRRVHPSVAQTVHVCQDAQQKEDAFASVCEEIFSPDRMDDQTGDKTIVFAGSKQNADDLTRKVRRYGRCVVGAHGGQTVESRDWAISAFRSGRFSTLVTTEGGVRNHDVGDVRFVVNYDYPTSSQEYVRRIGLAASFGTRGAVYTLFAPSDCRHAGELIAVLNEAKQGVVPELSHIAKTVQACGSKGVKRRR